MTDRILIVNADDYGLTEGVARGVLRAHVDGIVTSTSVMAVGPAFARTAPWLVDHPTLGVGAHLVLVGENPPLLSAAEIPTLVGRNGRLAGSWRSLVPRLAARRVDPGDVRRELAAQIERVQGVGVGLTHVDSHQHLHLWPGVGDIVLDLAAAAGITAVRIMESARRGVTGNAVAALGGRFARRAADRGFRFPAAAAGLDEAGSLVPGRLEATIARLGSSGASTAELATHPGERDAELDRYRWGYEWDRELAALLSPSARDAVVAAGFRLGSFADLPATAP